MLYSTAPWNPVADSVRASVRSNIAAGGIDFDQFDGQVVEVARLSWRILEHEHRLKQRRASRVTVRL